MIKKQNKTKKLKRKKNVQQKNKGSFLGDSNFQPADGVFNSYTTLVTLLLNNFNG